MTATVWSAVDEGYLRAHQWAASLAAGAALPAEASPLPLGPGEVAHLHLSPMGIAGHFGESGEYSRSLFLFGGPVGLALTGAASLANNAAKKAEAERAAIPRWHDLGTADVVMTNQRVAITSGGHAQSLLYAQLAPVQWSPAPGDPAVLVRAAELPPMRLRSPYAAILYVFVHHLLDGCPPEVPLPEGLLDRARAEGRVTS